MKTITSKKEILDTLPGLLAALEQDDTAFTEQLHVSVLQKKVRFPLLEALTAELYKRIPTSRQLPLLDRIVALDETGSYVIAGKMLQCRLGEDYEGSIEKAVEYIVQGNAWYVCDIIGERVYGHALLTLPERTIPVLEKQAKHPDNWIVRSVGVATHYAVKKGLPKAHVDEMFRLLLTLSGSTDFHTRRGIGWGAKTVAKFYPDILPKYKRELENAGSWFISKIQIGLGRAYKYAARYPR